MHQSPVPAVLGLILGVGSAWASPSSGVFSDPKPFVLPGSSITTFSPNDPRFAKGYLVNVPKEYESFWKVRLQTEPKAKISVGDVFLTRFFVRSAAPKKKSHFKMTLEGGGKIACVGRSQVDSYVTPGDGWREVFVPWTYASRSGNGPPKLSLRFGKVIQETAVARLRTTRVGRGAVLTSGRLWEDFFFFGAEHGSCQLVDPGGAVFDGKAFGIQVRRGGKAGAIGVGSRPGTGIAAGDKIFVVGYFKRGDRATDRGEVRCRFSQGISDDPEVEDTVLNIGSVWSVYRMSFIADRASDAGDWSVEVLAGGLKQIVRVAELTIIHVPKRG